MFVVIQEAASPIDREAVYRFRYRIVAEEFGKQYVGLDHERREHKTEYDDKARLLVALDRDSGAIVGSLRLWLGSDHPFPQELVDALQLKPMLDALGTHRAAPGSLMVDPPFAARRRRCSWPECSAPVRREYWSIRALPDLSFTSITSNTALQQAVPRKR